MMLKATIDMEEELWCLDSKKKGSTDGAKKALATFLVIKPEEEKSNNKTMSRKSETESHPKFNKVPWPKDVYI